MVLRQSHADVLHLLGATIPLIPRTPSPQYREIVGSAVAAGYGDLAMDVPIAEDLGKYLLTYLVDHDFDMAHSRYVLPEYGGRTARRYPGPRRRART